MYNRDENTYTMILGTQKVLEKNQEKFAEFSIFKEYFSRLNKDVQKLGVLIRKIDRLSKGTHQKKKRLEELLIKETYVLGVALALVARHKKDDVSYHRFKFSKRKLVRMRDTILMERGKMILKEALKKEKTLAKYGVALGRIKAFEKIVHDFSNSIGEAEAKVIERKVSRKDFKMLLKEVKGYLYYEMDSLMDVLENECPSFFQSYLKARNIKDLKRRRKRVKPKKIIEFKKIS